MSQVQVPSQVQDETRDRLGSEHTMCSGGPQSPHGDSRVVALSRWGLLLFSSLPTSHQVTPRKASGTM